MENPEAITLNSEYNKDVRINVSQSLIKGYEAYQAGGCGVQFASKYYYKTAPFISSEVMKLGQWFEFCATGALLRDGSEPVPELTAKKEFTSKYKLVMVQAELFKASMAHYGFEIISTGDSVAFDWMGIPVKMIIDVRARATKLVKVPGIFETELQPGEEFIIDLKNSGLLDDKWNDMGWADEGLSRKRKLMVQAIHYVWMEKLQGRNTKFFFFVHSNTNTVDRKIFHVNVLDSTLADHDKTIQRIWKSMQYDHDLGWPAKPDVIECASCPAMCAYRAHHALIKQITV
jgi:hypothetical protein